MSAIDQISSQRSGLMLVNGVAFAVWQATELTHLRELDSATLRILGASAVTLWICTTVGLLAPSFARSASTAKDELTRFNRLVALGWGYWVMMRFFLRYDSTGALAKLGSPVLSLKGSKDLQVDARDQYTGHTPGDRKQSGRNGRGDAWLNHLYQTAPTGALGEYADMEESFAPAALNPSSVTTHLAARSNPPRRGTDAA